MMQSRREFVRTALLGAAGATLIPGFARQLLAGTPYAAPGLSAAPDLALKGWELVPGILARIRPPVFPARDFLVTKYGAVGDGFADCTMAFREAVAACAAAGGGRVVVPDGRFLTGPIHLKSRVDLHVEKAATILFRTDPAAYLPRVLTRFEGVELMGLSPLIYAFGEKDIAITGEGVLDGQADESHWWPWKGNAQLGWTRGTPNQIAARKRLFEMAERGVPVARRVFGPDDLLRPSFVEPYRCTNVLIEGITIRRSPMWELHPTLCRNVTVRNVTIDTYGPNNDGCDPESCRDVLIEGCSFNTGDDCIAIKSGRNADGRRLHTPSENLVVRNCAMKDGHGGVSVGSEISGGVRNVFIEKCRMDSPHLERALRLKTNAMRGGVMDGIYMRAVTVGQVAIAVLDIDYSYEEGPNGPFKPVVRNVELRGVTSRKSEYAIFLKGFPASPIQDVRLIGCAFGDVAKPNVIQDVRGLVVQDTFVNGQPLRERAAA